MRIAKILSIAVVSTATLIVLLAAIVAIKFFHPSRSDTQQNFAPSNGRQAASPVGAAVLYSQASGDSSFLYRKDPSSGKSIRLTAAASGIESEPVFSHDGKLVVYSYAASPDSKSSVWVVGAGGQNPHAVSGNDQDALHPVFSPHDSKIFYAVSNFTGNHSPIVRPARHDWDVYAIPIQAGTLVAGMTSQQITHDSFYDLRSLDAAADEVTAGGTKILISTTGYPIGALIEQRIVGTDQRKEIFQPHVPGESKIGPSYGEARYIHDGEDILFLAATDLSGGTYDYNVYSMSDVTGAEIKKLTNLKGITRELRVLPNGTASFDNGESAQTLDISIHP